MSKKEFEIVEEYTPQDLEKMDIKIQTDSVILSVNLACFSAAFLAMDLSPELITPKIAVGIVGGLTIASIGKLIHSICKKANIKRELKERGMEE